MCNIMQLVILKSHGYNSAVEKTGAVVDKPRLSHGILVAFLYLYLLIDLE